jgi:hypothetical protein
VEQAYFPRYFPVYAEKYVPEARKSPMSISDTGSRSHWDPCDPCRIEWSLAITFFSAGEEVVSGFRDGMNRRREVQSECVDAAFHSNHVSGESRVICSAKRTGDVPPRPT